MSDRADLLQRLLLGDLDETSDEARRFFAEHPEARDELAALRGVEDRLRLARRERDLDLQAAAESPEAADPQLRLLLERGLAGGAAGPAPAPTGAPPAMHRVRRGWALAAAAAALLALLLWRSWTPPAPGPDLAPGPTLGSALRLDHPIGEVDAFDEFRWEYDLASGEYFELSVLDPLDPSHPLETVSDLEVESWTPDPDQVRQWPDSIEWQVSVKVDGRTARVQSASASSRSH